MSGLKPQELLMEERHRELVKDHAGKVVTYGVKPYEESRRLEPNADVVTGMGAESIRELLRRLDLDELAESLRSEMHESTSLQKTQEDHQAVEGC